MANGSVRIEKGSDESDLLAAGSGGADDPAPAGPKGRTTWTRAAIGVIVVVGLVLVGREAGAAVPRFAEWVDGLGFWGPVVFVAGYVVATVAFIPGSLLTLSAGAIFGIVEGLAIVIVGATLGATLAFVVSRTVARDAIERRLAGNARFAAIDRAVGSEGLKIVTLLRLSPVFPFNLLNYALGLTRVRLRDYVVACIGMVPGTLLYVYYGKLIGDVAALAGGARADRGAEYWAFLVIGLAATLVATTIVTRIARRALAKEISDV
jgi:uncharacterized membrane protein YdjX (TVP38/TMEM64 family)